MLEARRVMNGTHGGVFLDDDYVAECYECQAKVTAEKPAVGIPGVMMEDHKLLKLSGKGSLTMHKINSRMIEKLGEHMKTGRDLRFTVISSLADPDAFGTERVRITGVSFDELTLADWKHGAVTAITAPFTFTGYELIDAVSNY